MDTLPGLCPSSSRRKMTNSDLSLTTRHSTRSRRRKPTHFCSFGKSSIGSGDSDISQSWMSRRDSIISRPPNLAKHCRPSSAKTVTFSAELCPSESQTPQLFSSLSWTPFSGSLSQQDMSLFMSMTYSSQRTPSKNSGIILPGFSLSFRTTTSPLTLQSASSKELRSPTLESKSAKEPLRRAKNGAQ